MHHGASRCIAVHFSRYPTEDIPVKVTGNVKNGFMAEFVPIKVGILLILEE